MNKWFRSLGSKNTGGKQCLDIVNNCLILVINFSFEPKIYMLSHLELVVQTTEKLKLADRNLILR